MAEQARITDLKTQRRNANRHTPRGMQTLENSIQQDGWIGAITVAADGETFDGSARLDVGVATGFEDAIVVESDGSRPVVVKRTDILTADDPRAQRLGIAANRVASLNLDWDLDILQALQSEGLTDGLFRTDELDALFASLDRPTGDGGDDFDTTPGDGPTRCQPGELWLLGEHKLLCGDSTKAEDVGRLMGGGKADMVLTDPPYGMNLDTDWSDIVGALGSLGAAHNTRGNKYEQVIGDSEPYDPSPIFEHWGYCKEVFLFGADYYAERIPSRTDGSWLVWDKRKDSQADAIGAEFELCWSKAKHKRRVLRHDWFGFLSSANTKDAQNRVHPTQKPITLIADIMQQWGKLGDIVVDGYLGSGTTLIAAERTGRKCYGCEIEPRYADVVIKRWELETGREAVRVSG